MGRPKTINIRPRDVLTAIAQQIQADVADIDTRLAAAADESNPGWEHRRAWQQRCDLCRQRDEALVPIQDTEAWTGAATSSERIRGQQAIALLVGRDLLERDGRRVAITAAGWELLGLPIPKQVTPWEQTR